MRLTFSTRSRHTADQPMESRFIPTTVIRHKRLVQVDPFGYMLCCVLTLSRNPRNCIYYLHELRRYLLFSLGFIWTHNRTTRTCFMLPFCLMKIYGDGTVFSRAYREGNNFFMYRFLKNLKLVAVDELHYYSNIYGRFAISFCCVCLLIISQPCCTSHEAFPTCLCSGG